MLLVEAALNSDAFCPSDRKTQGLMKLRAEKSSRVKLWLYTKYIGDPFVSFLERSDVKEIVLVHYL